MINVLFVIVMLLVMVVCYGIVVAVDELKKNRGRLYDDQSDRDEDAKREGWDLLGEQMKSRGEEE